MKTAQTTIHALVLYVNRMGMIANWVMTKPSENWPDLVTLMSVQSRGVQRGSLLGKTKFFQRCSVNVGARANFVKKFVDEMRY